MNAPNYQILRALYLARGLTFFGPRPYDLNICLLRGPPILDAYADLFCVAYLDDRGQERCLSLPASTIPGAPTYAQLPNRAGAPMLAPGQYPSWVVSEHHGRPCLRPPGPLPVTRDNDRDATPGNTAIPSMSSGILIHGGSVDPTRAVGAWSEGCPVVTLGGMPQVVTLIGCQRAHGLGAEVSVAVVEVDA